MVWEGGARGPPSFFLQVTSSHLLTLGPHQILRSRRTKVFALPHCLSSGKQGRAGSPKITSTPQSISFSTITSAAIILWFALKSIPCVLVILSFLGCARTHGSSPRSGGRLQRVFSRLTASTLCHLLKQKRKLMRADAVLTFTVRRDFCRRRSRWERL